LRVASTAATEKSDGHRRPASKIRGLVNRDPSQAATLVARNSDLDDVLGVIDEVPEARS
jgi:hypothetical protein